MSRDNNYTIQSVLRALDVLIWLSENKGTGRITEIAEDLGCSKNTAFRLLYTLMDRGFVRQAEDSSYELTFKLLNLGESVLNNTTVHHVARSHIQNLSGETGETVSLAILDGDEIIYLDRVLGSSPFNTAYSIGSRAKAYTTALGKAILAFSPPEIVDRCLRGPLQSNTPYTMTKPDRIRLELREISRRYYALDNQENVIGIRCIGAPVFERNDNVAAAISLSGLAVHFTDERIHELVEPLLSTAAAVSERLGYTGTFAPQEMAVDGD